MKRFLTIVLSVVIMTTNAFGTYNFEQISEKYDKIEVLNGYWIEDSKIEYIYQAKKDGAIYILNNFGEEILKTNDNVSVYDANAEKTRFIVRYNDENSKYGLIDGNGELVIEGQYEYMYFLTETLVSVGVATKDYWSLDGVYDINGNEILPAIYDYIYINDDVIVASKDFEYEKFNLDGTAYTLQETDYTYEYDERLDQTFKKDKNGEIVAQVRGLASSNYDYLQETGYQVYFDSYTWEHYFVDENLEIVSESYDLAYDFEGEYATVQKNRETIILNKNFDVVGTFENVYYTEVIDEFIIVNTLNDVTEVYNMNGEKQASFDDYHNVGKTEFGGYEVSNYVTENVIYYDKNWEFLAEITNGEKAVNGDDFVILGATFCDCCYSEKVYYVDKSTGDILAEFENVQKVGVDYVCFEDKFYILDDKFNVVATHNYSMELSVSDKFIVHKEEKFGLIDKTGKIIADFEYDACGYVSENYVIVTKNDVMYLLNVQTGDLSDGLNACCCNHTNHFNEHQTFSAVLENETIILRDTESYWIANIQSQKEAKYNKSTVIVNGAEISFESYEVFGYNYFKLRDLAEVLKDTDKSFEIEYDEKNDEILVITGEKYTSEGGELLPGDGLNKIHKNSNSTVNINEELVEFEAINIDFNNYFKLRDIAKELDFYVGWDNDEKTITIDTNRNYVSE